MLLRSKMRDSGKQQTTVETRATSPRQQEQAKSKQGEKFRALKAKEAAKRAARLGAQVCCNLRPCCSLTDL